MKTYSLRTKQGSRFIIPHKFNSVSEAETFAASIFSKYPNELWRDCFEVVIVDEAGGSKTSR